jgi:hypothetical protein
MNGEKNYSDGSLYFIRCRGIYKIGISSNPKQRFQNIELGMQSPVGVIVEGPCIDMEEIGNDARRAEKIWHTHLARYRIGGEWFNLPARIAKRVESMMWSEELPPQANKLDTPPKCRPPRA